MELLSNAYPGRVSGQGMYGLTQVKHPHPLQQNMAQEVFYYPPAAAAYPVGEQPKIVAGSLVLVQPGTSPLRTLTIPYNDIILSSLANVVSTDAAAKVVSLVVAPAVTGVEQLISVTIELAGTFLNPYRHRYTVSVPFAADSALTTAQRGAAFVAEFNARTEIPLTAAGTTTITLTADVAGAGFSLEGANGFASGSVTTANSVNTYRLGDFTGSGIPYSLIVGNETKELGGLELQYYKKVRADDALGGSSSLNSIDGKFETIVITVAFLVDPADAESLAELTRLKALFAADVTL